MNKMKLHLGCGRNRLLNFINIDIDPSFADKVCDITDLHEFEDDSIDEIYCSHALEHFSYKQILKILNEWNRVLKIDGILRISVPDFEQIIKYYSDHENLEILMGLLYGGQRNEYDYHKCGFTFNSINSLLQHIGFHQIQKYDWKDFLSYGNDDYSRCYLPHMDENGTLMSLNIIAKKKFYNNVIPHDVKLIRYL